MLSRDHFVYVFSKSHLLSAIKWRQTEKTKLMQKPIMAYAPNLVLRGVAKKILIPPTQKMQNLYNE